MKTAGPGSVLAAVLGKDLLQGQPAGQAQADAARRKVGLAPTLAACSGDRGGVLSGPDAMGRAVRVGPGQDPTHRQFALADRLLQRVEELRQGQPAGQAAKPVEQGEVDTLPALAGHTAIGPERRFGQTPVAFRCPSAQPRI